MFVFDFETALIVSGMMILRIGIPALGIWLLRSLVRRAMPSQI
jgi:hypothetical protein